MDHQIKGVKLQLESGEVIDNAQAPVIVSASRSTDIPAFYADWFFHRLSVGYSAWTNPFNGQKSYVSYHDTRFIVFWSKNPYPLLKHLEKLERRDIKCYIQYTLNDYASEEFERVPSLQKRMDTFKRLVDRLGFGSVIWRFDPLIVTDRLEPEILLRRIEDIGDQLKGYIEKMVFSFVDIAIYKKVKLNLERDHVPYREWTAGQMEQFASTLSLLNHKWGYQLATCSEQIDLEKYGIVHNRCIDDNLIIRMGHSDKELMRFLGVTVVDEVHPIDLLGTMPDFITLRNGQFAIKSRSNKDKGQRKLCGCIQSKDIGAYNTCPHCCKYCYANTSGEMARLNYRTHLLNPYGEMITSKQQQ
ncbi:MAG: DUF1848 domain-containing protein [Mediterranea sp.]|jgi:DNA repair photolyase|nr:DUF1848 domain-containing protein [Mediterranea sp.]